MAIQPPSFNITPIAPRQRDDSLSNILNQIIGLTLQSRFNEGAATLAHGRRLEADAARDVALGERSAATDLANQASDIFSRLATGTISVFDPNAPNLLDAEGIDFLPTPEGLKFGGSLVSAAELREHTRFTGAFGREAIRDDVTVADTTNAQGQQIQGVTEGLVKGDAEATIGQLKGILDRADIAPTTASSVKALIEQIRADESFVLSEEVAALDRFGATQITNIDTLYQRERQMDREQRALSSRFMNEMIRTVQILETDSNGVRIRRDLNPTELNLFGQEAAGMILSEEETAFLDATRRNSRNRVTAYDRQEMFFDAFHGAGNPEDTQRWTNFLGWLRTNLFAADGSGTIINPELEKLIRASSAVAPTGPLTPGALRAFAIDGVGSSELRGAFALKYGALLGSRSSIQAYLREGGVLGIGLKPIMDAYATVDPSFNDVAADPSVIPSAGPLGGNMGDSRNDREDQRGVAGRASAAFNSLLPSQRVDLAANLKNATPEELTQIINNLRRGAASNSDSQVRLQFETYANVLEEGLRNPLLLDSIIVAIEGGR